VQRTASPAARPPSTLALGAITLERWRAGDVEDLHEAVSSTIEHLLPWMPWAREVDRDARARFLRESEQGWAAGGRFEYAVRDAQAALIGGIGLMSRIGPRGLEIGYWVHAAHTRRGVATLAAAAVTEAALGLAEIDHVEIHHDEANLASGRVPARLGFSRTATFAQKPTAPGEIGVEVRWRLNESDFQASAAAALLESVRRPY
jgi:RimJ/RimL family protein N-acetyltransferase